MNKRTLDQPLRIALIYFLFSGVWILCSDRLLATLIQDPEQLVRWQTYKGTFFIFVVSLLIYFLLKRDQKLQQTTQKALSESQNSFQNLFANNPYPMWVYDLETLRFLAVNEAAVNHYGYSLEEFQQMDITDIRPKEDVPAVLANIVQDRPVYQASGQWRHRTKAGKVFPVEIFSHSLAFSGRKAALVAAIDISDRQAALSALKKTESERQELQQIIDRSPVMVFLWQAEASRPVEYVSESVHKLGYNPEELTSGRMRYMEIIDPEDRPRIKAETEANIQAGIDEYIQEYRVFAKDGSKHWVEDRTYIRRDPNGKVLDIRGILQDITERKQAEIALQDTDRRLKEIIDALPDPTFVVDKDGYVLVWNRAIEEMTGVPAKSILGKGNYEYALPFYHQRRPMLTDWVLNRTEVREYYPHAEQNQGSVTAEVFLPDFKGGIYIWVKVTPLYDSYGHLAGAIETIRDITERKRFEEELKRANDEMELRVQQRTSQVETANRELEAFSYSVSHDLRAPLRHIDGFSQALVEDCYDQLDETGQRYVERIRAGTQQMAELIDALLNLSRLTRVELKIEKVDLGPLARKILDDLQKQEPNRKVKLVVNKPLRAEGDSQLLTVLLQNLLANSWKFTVHTSRPKIELGISGEKAGKPIYYVRDNGAGFDMAYADKLFGAFQRLHGKDEFPGTGIGLATVKRIVTRHGGEIWAEGAVGQGATFYFIL